MATSTFKSNSRRPPAVESKASSRRRSHSVSAVSKRTGGDNISVSAEFSNSRENPLFWTRSSSPRDGNASESVSSANRQFHDSDTIITKNSNESGSSAGEQRGRPATRGVREKNGIGRSSSRVRGRSESRTPMKGAYESKTTQDMMTTVRSRNETKKIGNGTTRANYVTRGRASNARVVAAQNRALDGSEDDSICSFQTSNFEDRISIGSLSEVEEKTAKLLCEDLSLMSDKWDGSMPCEIYETAKSEVRRAIYDIQNNLQDVLQRNNRNSLTAANIGDTPLGLLDSDAVAIKLEESEERARKLRADLAIEEHRGKELDRILKEMHPNPKISVQKSHRGRRASNERKQASKRLSEEAMAYFDECVSISTFDSSDFSAPEDHMRYSSVGLGGAIPLGASSPAKGSANTSFHCTDPHQNQTFTEQSCSNGSGPTADSTSAIPGNSQLYEYSFANNKSEINEDIRSCIKIFDRGSTSSNSDKEAKTTKGSYYDAEEYNAHSRIESLAIDRVLDRSRIESGGLLLCGGAATSVPPFGASIML